MHIVTKNHICGTYWLVGGCWWWFVVILVVFGDFSVFSVIFVVHICHICCHICIIFVILFMPHRKVSWHQQKFFTRVIFTPVGNSGPNPCNPYGHLVHYIPVWCPYLILVTTTTTGGGGNFFQVRGIFWQLTRKVPTKGPQVLLCNFAVCNFTHSV